MVVMAWSKGPLIIFYRGFILLSKKTDTLRQLPAYPVGDRL
jgi:hypothetical protein